MRTDLMKMTMALLGVVLLGGNVSAAGESAGTRTVLLTLKEGVAPAEPGDRYTRDMEIELTLRDGGFDKKVWGYAIGFNKAHHRGELTATDGDDLLVTMVINRDKWFPSAPGKAKYRITLKREDDIYTGSYTGSFSYPATPGPVTRAVAGKVTGKAFPLWTEPPAGFRKLGQNEHPRLIFRKHDLPMIKKRLGTREGKAIMARFLEQLPKNHATHPKCRPYFPAGYALAYQLTGDKAHAEKAKGILAGMLDIRGSQDIHYGPMAQAMAVTLDLCYDAWDEEFRQTVIDNLARRLRNLDTLSGMGGASLNPWHNHEAIRVAGAGTAAICLLGEKTSDGKDIPGLDRIIHTAALATRRYFLWNGTSNSGWGLEGNFYKRMTWNSGPGHMIHAYRTAFGGDMMAGWQGCWSMLGEWMWQPPSEKIVTSEGLRSDQDSGLFVLGWSTVPDSMKAGARWLFDHAYGLQGDGTFGLLWAYHAGYLLMNYPFDVVPKPPAESLPWVAPDPTGGHWVFRKPWQGAGDTLVVLNVRHDFPGGTHWNTGRSWDMQLFALGRRWIGDRVMTEKTGRPGAALPTVSNPGAFNDGLSARLTAWSTTADGRAVLSFDMSPIYMQQPARGAKPGPGQKLVRMSRAGTFVDLGITAERHVALDLTGTCGAPVLFAVVDRFAGADDLLWKMSMPGVTVREREFTVGTADGPNLHGCFVPVPGLKVSRWNRPPPKPVKVDPRIPEFFRGKMKKPKIKSDPDRLEATGSDRFFVVFTVQNGKPPAINVAGEGLSAKVSIGGQSISFDGKRIVLPGMDKGEGR